jgi:hypothetical protein
MKAEPGRARRLRSPFLASAQPTANQLFLRPLGWHTCHSIIHPLYRTEPILCLTLQPLPLASEYTLSNLMILEHLQQQLSF